MLNQPPTILLTAVSQLEANQMIMKDETILNRIYEIFRRHPDIKEAFARPQGEDRLFQSTYDHLESEISCLEFDPKEEVHRAPRASTEPKIHYGTIASGSHVIKDGRERDMIAQDFHALCFEMEAAGIMNHLPTLVIRGICDYCDSHKNKQWQKYAALVAALYSKILLSVIPVEHYHRDVSQSTTSSKGHWMVPFDRNPRFIGRDEIVNMVRGHVLSPGQARKAAISGLGGVGKTQIALEIAYQIHDQDPTRSVFWIPCTSIEIVEQAFMSINKKLQLRNVTAGDYC